METYLQVQGRGGVDMTYTQVIIIKKNPGSKIANFNSFWCFARISNIKIQGFTKENPVVMSLGVAKIDKILHAPKPFILDPPLFVLLNDINY